MPYAQINGIQYYYEDEGGENKDAPVLFLIHGLGENAQSWKEQRAYFKSSFRVITPDLRGHGHTEDGDVNHITIEQYAQDMVALLDVLEIKKAHMVGFSMGGLIVQDMTAHHQDRMATLVISNATSFYAKEQIDRALGKRLDAVDHMTMDELAHMIVQACLPHDEDKSSPFYIPVKEGVYEEMHSIFAQNRLLPYKAATKATFLCNTHHLLKDIKIPTMILSSHFDRATPIPYGQHLQTHIAFAKMQILPTGHLSKMQEPDMYCRALKEFLYAYEPQAVQRLKHH